MWVGGVDDNRGCSLPPFLPPPPTSFVCPRTRTNFGVTLRLHSRARARLDEEGLEGAAGLVVAEEAGGVELLLALLHLRGRRDEVVQQHRNRHLRVCLCVCLCVCVGGEGLCACACACACACVRAFVRVGARANADRWRVRQISAHSQRPRAQARTPSDPDNCAHAHANAHAHAHARTHTTLPSDQDNIQIDPSRPSP